MPIEIRELVIKVQVDENRSSNDSPNVSGADDDIKKEMLLAECLEQVSRMLKSKKER